MNPTPSRPDCARGSLAWLGVGGAVLLLLLGCRAETKQKWLTFFFDGVPVPGAETNRVVQLDEDGRPLVFPDRVTNAAGVVVSTFVRHPPYEERNCTACHLSKFSVKMKGPQVQFCFECHDNFLAQAAIKHQPVENGGCTDCHAPHGSAHPKMLVRAVPALCLDCHENIPGDVPVKHQPVELGECSSCHAPHVSSNKSLLVRAGAALCWECHDNFLERAEFTHAPAESGDCSVCHQPHGSEHAGLLLQKDPQLCFECHEEAEMAKIQAHPKPGLAVCVTCHDPHRSRERYLLKPEALTAGPVGLSDPAPAAKTP